MLSAIHELHWKGTMAVIRCLLILVFVLLTLVMEPAKAAPSRCLAIAQSEPDIRYVNLTRAGLKNSEVKITYTGHSTFLIESASGVTIATDYAGYAGPDIIPKVVTMNYAHETHYTDYPDPSIEHVLRGWNPDGGEAHHDLEVGDVQIRNVPTDIRSWSGEAGVFGNSIFIFEIAGLCIGHLGHLHHTPTPQHYGMIGLLDIVMVPVDGTFTLNIQSMIDVVKTIRARMIIPMHYFGTSSLKEFLDALGEQYEVEIHPANSIIVSDENLPDKPKVLVLPAY